LTPGRVAESLAAAGTASLNNVFLHLDWNQASIDSNQVCREDGRPGDYVQWSPMELFYLHDWNVVFVPDGRNIQQIFQAQCTATAISNGQPTAVVYRTIKGWGYGIEGRASHGAGHKLCSEGFYRAISELTGRDNISLPTCTPETQRCMAGPDGAGIREDCFWEALLLVRKTLQSNRSTVQSLASAQGCKGTPDRRGRRVRDNAPQVGRVYELPPRRKAYPRNCG